jgi:toxin ParE1/3/4
VARQIIWSNRAYEDLESVFEYIARDSKKYARIQVETIVNKIESLIEYPLIGRSIPELSFSGYREVIASNYRVIYRYNNERVYVVAITHSRRSLDKVVSKCDLIDDLDF